LRLPRRRPLRVPRVGDLLPAEVGAVPRQRPRRSPHDDGALLPPARALVCGTLGGGVPMKMETWQAPPGDRIPNNPRFPVLGYRGVEGLTRPPARRPPFPR